MILSSVWTNLSVFGHAILVKSTIIFETRNSSRLLTKVTISVVFQRTVLHFSILSYINLEILFQILYFFMNISFYFQTLLYVLYFWENLSNENCMYFYENQMVTLSLTGTELKVNSSLFPFTIWPFSLSSFSGRFTSIHIASFDGMSLTLTIIESSLSHEIWTCFLETKIFD